MPEQAEMRTHTSPKHHNSPASSRLTFPIPKSSPRASHPSREILVPLCRNKPKCFVKQGFLLRPGRSEDGHGSSCEPVASPTLQVGVFNPPHPRTQKRRKHSPHMHIFFIHSGRGNAGTALEGLACPSPRFCKQRLQSTAAACISHLSQHTLCAT